MFDFAKGISVNCRDQGGLLMDTFLETQQVYGDNGGADGLEDVIQDILDDHINTPSLGSVTLFFPDGTGGTPRPQGGATDPAWQIKEYVQSKMSVMEAIRRLARMIGWEVRSYRPPMVSLFRRLASHLLANDLRGFRAGGLRPAQRNE